MICCPEKPRRQTGFTLLELLVAVTIFGIMTTLAYGGLTGVSKSRVASEAALDRLAEVQRAVALMQADLEQLRPRPARDEYGDIQAALKSSPGFAKINLELTRGGALNSPNGLLRVGYGLADGQLYRYQWPVLDRAPDSTATPQPILSGVESLTISFLDSAGETQSQWPPENLAQSLNAQAASQAKLSLLPVATNVELELQDHGVIRRVFHGVY